MVDFCRGLTFGWAAIILLSLLWSLVEVHSQTEYPYVSFMGENLTNHSYVDLTLVGEDDDSDPGNVVRCHTDLETCCTSSQGIHRGDLYFPDSDRVEPSGDIYRSRGAQSIILHRRNNALSPSGIYHCEIPTNADNSDRYTGGVVYVGLYASGGDIVITSDVLVTVDSDLNGASPQFTLTCISTGGPATNVTWTRDSVTVTEGNETVLDDSETAQYNHTLTVTGRLSGLYTCTVANDKPSVASKHISLQVTQPTVVIRRSHSGSVHVGTALTLTADITFSDVGVVDLFLDISWTRDGVDISGDDHIIVSAVSGSGSNYTASLSYSPITTDDGGLITVTVTPSDGSQFTQTVTAQEMIDVEDLPDPEVTVSPDTTITAGSVLELTCTVTVVENLIVQPIVQWSGGSVNGDGVTVSATTVSGVTSTRNLTFSPLLTSHGAQYTCQATINIPSIDVTKTGSNSTDVMVQIPSPEVMVSASQSELVSGTPLTLSCSITQPNSVTTPTTVMSSWTAPNSVYDMVNAVNDTSVELVISSVETADSGDYICSATLTDSSGSSYIAESQPATNTTTVTVKLNVTVSAIYTPAPGEDPEELGANEFTAGCALSLDCTLQGNTGALTYAWSVSGNPATPGCTRCNIDLPPNAPTLVLGHPALNSYFAGVYTCTVSESGRPDSGNNDDFTVTVVGAGIYAANRNDESQINARGPIANNGLIVSASDGGLRLECVSNSSQSGVGMVTTSDGVTLNIGYNAGALRFQNPSSRPGVLRLQTRSVMSMTASDQGIYTCTIPDSNDNTFVFNVGLYPNGFNVSPTITDLTYDEESRTLTCVSTGSPATTVSWMRDGLSIDDSTHYTHTQTVTDRANSTYSNVLTVSEGAPGGVAGTYTCTVSNELGSDSEEVEAVGITISGLENPLTVGLSATISCMTNIAVDSIEWMDQSGVLNMSDVNATNLTMLEYNITLVMDDLHREQFSCIAMAGSTTYTETVDIQVEVPAGSLEVVTADISQDGPMEAGSGDLTLTCTVREVISGLTNMPYALWSTASGPVTSEDDIVINKTIGDDITLTETLRNATHSSVTLSFSSLHTSHAGQYMCQGTLDSPAAENNITSTPDNVSVNVILPTPNASVDVPSGPLYEGTSQTLTCSVTLPDTVDTDVNVTVDWILGSTPITSGGHVEVSPVSSARPPFMSTLRPSPLIMADAGQYSCQATATSSSPYITHSGQGLSREETLTVTALPAPNVSISFSGNSTAGLNYSLECSVIVVEHLVVLPYLMIVFPNSPVISEENNSSVVYTFSPLRTSDGGQYTCTATVNIPKAEIIDLQDSKTDTITVAIPRPSISFSGLLVYPVNLSSSTTLYSGTVFTLTCVVELVPEVDTAVTVLTSWSKDERNIASDDRITAESEAVHITTTATVVIYKSDILFNPLSNMQSGGDDGEYTCSVQAKDQEFINGSNSTATQNIISVENLGPPLVTVVTNGISTAGEAFSVECRVETVEGVRSEDISITWKGPDGIVPSENHPVIEDLTTAGNVTTGRLVFSSLSTSDGGQYTCTGRISVSNVGVDVSGNNSTYITVSIPPPAVSVSLNTDDDDDDGSVYQGTELVITCTAIVNSAVDIEFDVSIEWSIDPAEVMNGSYLTISGTSGSGHEYNSTVTISPVNTTDSAIYTCTASITTPDTDYIIPNNEASDSEDITVEELMAPAVYEESVTSIAGQSLSVECNFTKIPNLVTAPSVQWLSSTGSVVSNDKTFTLSHLLTSHGGSYTCIVKISIPHLNILLTANGSTTVTVEIPAPSVMIEPVGTPYNGSEYILTCTVTVDDSVNTNITISSQWMVPPGTDTTDNTISDSSERVGELQLQHSLTFSPLRSGDSGEYTCNARITPNENMKFIVMASNNLTHHIQTEELPLPVVKIRFTSASGSEEESCLGVYFTDSSDSITCVAGVVSNLLHPPDINLTEGETSINTANALSLTQEISTTTSDAGPFTCTVCIEVPEADIKDHCSNKTVSLSRMVPATVSPVISTTSSDSSITIQWDRSSEDIVRYIVSVREYVEDGLGKAKTNPISGYPLELPGIQLNHSVELLKPMVPYDVQLVAGNVLGCGAVNTSQPFFTREGAPTSAPHDVVVERLPNGTAMNVSFTRLSLVEARSVHITYTVRYSLTSFSKRDSSVEVVVVPDLHQQYVLIGDLDPSKTYHVIVEASNSLGSRSSPAQSVPPVPSEVAGPGSGAVVAGVVVSLLVVSIAALVLGVILIRRRRQRASGKSQALLSSKRGLYNVRPIKDPEMIELEGRVIPSERPPPQQMESFQTFSPPRVEVDEERMKAVPVEQFEEHCNNYHRERDAAFEIEYETLVAGPMAAHAVSQLLINKPKNRFANIFPYDESRVVLEEIPGVEGSNYINASWIHGYKRENAYIAAQGPKPATIEDFWRMVWQYKVSHIVMVTGVYEGGRKKCEQYWHEEVGEAIELEDVDLKIITTSITTHRDFVIRTMNLKKITEPDGKPLSVTQYHFTSWPDHGVPKIATSLISFIRRVQKAHNKDDEIPLLVHCSAGVGRTGTFILLDSMLERIKAEKSVNVYEFLMGLRQKRVLMVQTLAQYVFVHDTLCEVIQCGDTEIPASRLTPTVKSMAQSLPGQTITGFQEQFQLLDQVSRKPVEEDFVSAREHASKNRYPDRLPYPQYIPHLKQSENEDSYINASFIDGYKYHRAYMATQGPLQSTVGDIWRMMWEFKSKVMVMLCDFTEDGHEACHPFWPSNEGDSAKYGKIKVTFQSQGSYGEFTTRKLLMEEEQTQGEGVVVTQFHMTGWPEHGRPASTGSVVEMLDMITKAQMSSGNRSITVLCNDGVGRSGTFICLHSQLERLKTEGVVDFFQAVKSARTQRAGLVKDADQYAYCHEVLGDFVNSYDNYANFKDVV